MTDSIMSMEFLLENYLPEGYKTNHESILEHGFFGLGKKNAFDAIKLINETLPIFEEDEFEVVVVKYEIGKGEEVTQPEQLEIMKFKDMPEFKDLIPNIEVTVKIGPSDGYVENFYHDLLAFKLGFSQFKGPYGVLVRPKEKEDVPEIIVPGEFTLKFNDIPFIAIYEPGGFGEVEAYIAGRGPYELNIGLEAINGVLRNPMVIDIIDVGMSGNYLGTNNYSS